MGSGTSKDFVEVLQQHPSVSYTGIEVNPASLAKAKELLADCGNVTFLNDFGEKMTQQYEDYFDMTLSLSVLEHVKYIEEFLATSVRVTKPGGRIIHRYDLGHSLHSNMREKAKVFLCNTFPWLMPARYFTCHPSSKHLVQCLEAAGVGSLEDILFTTARSKSDDESDSLGWRCCDHFEQENH